jgi:hypothetical protein
MLNIGELQRLRRPRPRAAYSDWFTMCSAVHATRARRHPELVPLRSCLRLRKTTPVPLVQVLSLLAQCAPGVWSYQSQRARPLGLPPGSPVERFRAACIHHLPQFRLPLV